MSRFFVEGGFGMYPTLAFGLLMLVVGVVYAARREQQRLISLFAILGAVTFVCGAFGTVMGIATTSFYVGRLAPSVQYATTVQGIAESLHNLALAYLLIVLSTLIVAAGALRAAIAAGPERS